MQSSSAPCLYPCHEQSSTVSPRAPTIKAAIITCHALLQCLLVFPQACHCSAKLETTRQKPNKKRAFKEHVGVLFCVYFVCVTQNTAFPCGCLQTLHSDQCCHACAAIPSPPSITCVWSPLPPWRWSSTPINSAVGYHHIIKRSSEKEKEQ